MIEPRNPAHAASPMFHLWNELNPDQVLRERSHRTDRPMPWSCVIAESAGYQVSL